MEADERLPLVQKANIKQLSPKVSPRLPGKSIRVKSLIDTHGFLRASISVPVMAMRCHSVSITCAMLSTIICWWMGLAEHSVVDPMIFKSIFVVFGFALGFRNVRANQRYGEAMQNCKVMFGVAWGLISSFRASELQQRLKVEKAVTKLMHGIVQHLNSIQCRHDSWWALVGLHPLRSTGEHDILDDGFRQLFKTTEKEIEHLGEKDIEQVEVQLGPRPLIVSTFVMVGNELCRLERRPLQERKRNHWLVRQQFFEAYEYCETLSLPSVTSSYQMLLTSCLFLFGVAAPWGISVGGVKTQFSPHDGLDKSLLQSGHVHLHDSRSLQAFALLALNTLFCVLILFGLNSLAHENEQPFKRLEDVQHYHIDLNKLLARFQQGVNCYEHRRRCAQKQMVSGPPWSTALADNLDAEAAFNDMAENLLLATDHLLGGMSGEASQGAQSLDTGDFAEDMKQHSSMWM